MLLETVRELENKRFMADRLASRWSPLSPWSVPDTRDGAWYFLVDAINEGLHSSAPMLLYVRDGEPTDGWELGFKYGPPFVVLPSVDSLYGSASSSSSTTFRAIGLTESARTRPAAGCSRSTKEERRTGATGPTWPSTTRWRARTRRFSASTDGGREERAAGLDPTTGKYIRIRETVHGTKTDARKRRNELLVAVARGTVVRADRENVSAFLERWIAHRESIGKIRPKVAHTYCGYVRREVNPRIGSMHLAAVRPIHVQKVIDEALAAGLSHRTVVQVHRVMHAAFRSAVRWQAIAVNPSDGVMPPKIEAPTLIVPSPEDVSRLLAEADPRYRVAFALAAGTGLRRGEVLPMKWAAWASRRSASRGRSNERTGGCVSSRRRRSVHAG